MKISTTLALSEGVQKDEHEAQNCVRGAQKEIITTSSVDRCSPVLQSLIENFRRASVRRPSPNTARHPAHLHACTKKQPRLSAGSLIHEVMPLLLGQRHPVGFRKREAATDTTCVIIASTEVSASQAKSKFDRRAKCYSHDVVVATPLCQIMKLASCYVNILHRFAECKSFDVLFFHIVFLNQFCMPIRANTRCLEADLLVTQHPFSQGFALIPGPPGFLTRTRFISNEPTLFPGLLFR